MSVDQMRAVWSAEHVARWRTSGDSSTRVMYWWCAAYLASGTSDVESRLCIMRQAKTLPW
jgi:hypothetical protein